MAEDPPAARPGSEPERTTDSTATLLESVKQGDRSARDRLLARYLVTLRRWARGRLPARARDLVDTDDLVQVTLIRALDHMEGFEPRRDGAFTAYLHRALVNQIRDELRRVARRPMQGGPEDELVWPGPSPLEELVGREALEDFESALGRLREDQ